MAGLQMRRPAYLVKKTRVLKSMIDMTRRFCLLPIFFIVFSLSAIAQGENCSDGIDNDGDGFVDCYDSDCANSPDCEGFFLNDNAFCEVEPTEFPEFKIQQLKKSDPGTVSNHSVLVVGDIMGDATPEIVAANGRTYTLSILDGKELTTLAQRTVPDINNNQEYLAIAKINGKGFIFLNRGKEIIAYDTNLDEVWRTGKNGVQAMHDLTSAIHLADFNRDGKPELYYANEIRDAETGKILHSGNGDWLGQLAASSVAADMDDDPSDLELVNGLTIYKVASDWKLKEIAKYKDYHPYLSFSNKQNHNFTSVADYDGNGELDVIANGSIKKGSQEYPTVFLWLNPFSESVVKTFSFDNATHNRDRDAPNGTGIVNIANIDNVPGLNCTFAVKEYVYALDENFKFKWRLPIVEKSSGNTGTTVFDFNGDGQSEIVFRDEHSLYIIQDENGTPKIKENFVCGSQTFREYPVVADVNADGETEIVVSCAAVDASWSGTPPNPEKGVVKMFASLDEKWVQARKVWNQHGYFNVNINDDLTVPKEQQKHHLAFSEIDCKTGEYKPVKPLNSFLNQSPFLNSSGCPSYASPDIAFDDSSLEIKAPTCPDTDFQVSFSLVNLGDVAINKKIYVSFYDGVPKADLSNKLNTDSVEISMLNPGESVIVNDLNVKGPGGAFELYVRINDPVAVSECEPSNNTFSKSIVPLPFSIAAEKINDNYKCDDSVTDNGRARAYVLPDITAGYDFIWYKSNGTGYDSVYTGIDYSSMAEGDYKIRAVHKTLQCGSDTASVAIGRISDPQEVLQIEQTAPLTNCGVPDGVLTAKVLIGGVEQDPAGYEFKWFDGSVFGVTDPIDFDSEAAGLADKNYKVEVRNPLTGCLLTGSETVTSEAKKPLLEGFIVAHVEACGETGAIEVGSAKTTAGETLDPSTDLTYRWYSNAADTAGSLISGAGSYRLEELASGDYGVVAILNSNGCPSVLEAVTVNDAGSEPDISVSVQGSSSCDGINHDGAITIEYRDAKPGHYEVAVYPWDDVAADWGSAAYTGDVSSGGSVNVGSLAPNTYRIVAINNSTVCFDQTSVVDDVSGPLDPSLIAIFSTPQTNCDDSAPNGRISATYDGKTAGYIFEWHQGSGVKASADYTGHAYEGIQDSTYTLVVTEEFTGCKSAAVTGDVAFTPELPAPVASVAPNTSCETPDGSILATSGPAGTYVFEIYDGSTLLATADADGSTGFAKTGLGSVGSDKTYRIVATHKGTLCSAAIFAQVEYQPDIPTIDAASIELQSNAMCAAPYDGVIEASMAVLGDASGYEFFWSGPEGAIAEKGPAISGLKGGLYRLEVRKLSSGCMSAPADKASITLQDELIYPTVSLSVAKEQTACAGPVNGEVAGFASMPSGPEPSLGYKFRWSSLGSVIDSSTVWATPARDTLKSLAGNKTYRLTVVNNNTGCLQESTIYLPEKILYPQISDAIVASPNGYCAAPFNGYIDASAAPYMEDSAYEPASGYTFKWYNSASVPIANDGPVLDSLNAGVYKLKAVNNYTQCESQTYKLIEVTNAFDPVVVHIDTLNHQTHCSDDETHHNGSLSASAIKKGVKTVTGYQFEWRRGLSMSQPVIGEGAAISGLTNAVYSVKVTSDSTRCFGVADALVRNEPRYPVVEAAAGPVTRCDPYDGWVEATVDGSAVDHTFYWYDGTSVKSAPDLTGSVYSGLAYGSYTVYAVVDSTQCPSDPLTVEVEDHTVKVEVDFLDVSSPAHCNDAGGQLTLRLKTAGVSALQFDWFKGTDPVPIYSNSGAESKYFGMTSGNYRFELTNLDDGCKTDTAYYLPFMNESELTIPKVIDAKLCKDPYYGSIEVDLEVHPSVAAMGYDKYDFMYLLFEGVHVIGDGKGIGDAYRIIFPDGDPATPLRFDNLKKGQYTVSVVDWWDAVNRCEERPLDRVIEIGVELPKVTASVVNPDFSCDPVNPNGVLTATAVSDPALDVKGYTFSWHAGDETTPSLGPGVVTGSHLNVSELTNLGKGSYVVRALNDSTGCDTTATVYLPRDLRELTIRNVEARPQDQCSPANGSLLVGDVWEDNQSYSSIFHYTLEVLDASSAVAASGQELNTPIENLAAGEYVIKAVNDSTLCEAYIDATVGVDTLNPAIVRDALVHDQYCAPANVGNGSVSVAVDEILQGGDPKAVAGYLFEWFDASGDPISSGYALSGIPSGSYTVRVTDTQGKYLNCVSSETFVIEERNPEVAIAQATVSDQTYCVGDNGSIEVAEVTLNGSPVAMSDVTIELIEGASVATGQPFIRNQGVYQLRATYDPFQCVSEIFTVEIGLDRPVYSIDFVVSEDFSCDNVNGQGQLTASVYENGTLLTGGFEVEWFDAAKHSIGSASHIGGLADGRYYIAITDVDGDGLGCAHSDSVYLSDDLRDIEIAALDIADQDICLPNGSIAVVEVREDGSVTGDAYTFKLYDANGEALSPAGSGSSGDPFTGLGAGRYYVSAFNTLTGCEMTGYKEARIEDVSVAPIVSLSVVHEQDRLSPPAVPSGQVRAEASEAIGAAGLYEINWYYEAILTASVSGVQSHTLVDRPAGWHTAVVRNLSTNCAASGQIEIPEKIASPEVGLASTAAGDCNGSGSIDVSSVTIAGIGQDPGDFDFDLYRDFVVPSNLMATIDGSVETRFTGLHPGVYYVKARLRDINNYLESEPFRVEVEDHAVYPAIDVREILPQRSFNPDPSRHNGRIWLVVDGAHVNAGGYEAEWRRGGDASSPILAQYANSFVADGLTEGYYTFQARDLASGCASQAVYRINEELTPVVVSASSKPNAYCVGANGQLGAGVVSGDVTSSYDYYWYVQGEYVPGSGGAGSVYTGNIQNGVSEGIYTVYAVDKQDEYRFGKAVVEVQTSRYSPQIVVKEIHPQVNCDPARPTGHLAAELGFDAGRPDNPSYYDIAWLDSQGREVAAGRWDVDRLPAQTFVVRLTHKESGCVDESEPFQVSESLKIAPVPTTQIVSHLTSCAQPNGAVVSSVDGSAYNYEFRWYFGPEPMGKPDRIDPMIYDLNTGHYSVTATSLETGCTSKPAMATIEDRRVYPEIEIATTNAKCEEPNGSAQLTIKNRVSLDEIIWSDGFRLSYGFNFDNQPAGQYQVTVTTTQQCETTQDFVIRPDILIYNGVSANGDGVNEKFVIGCIDEFYENNVKIFNRSGDIVFETDNYDNEANSFTGEGNRGLYIGKPELPIGTYFYIIDLKDGSTPRTGYLELVR